MVTINESNQIRLVQMGSPLAIDAKDAKLVNNIYKVAKAITDRIPDFKAVQPDYKDYKNLKDAEKALDDAKKAAEDANKAVADARKVYEDAKGGEYEKAAKAKLDEELDSLTKANKNFTNADSKAFAARINIDTAQQDFWNDLDLLETYADKIVGAIEKGAVDGIDEMKVYRNTFNQLDSKTGTRLGADKWLDGLSEIVKKQAKEFKPLKDKVEDVYRPKSHKNTLVQTKDLKDALEDFQTISKHKTSKNTFRAMWYKIGENVPWGKDIKKAMDDISPLIKYNEDQGKGLLELVQELSKEFTMSRLAADARNITNKQGFNLALRLLEAPDIDKYVMQIKGLEVGSGGVSLAWRMDARSYWLNLQNNMVLSPASIAKKDDIELALDYLDRHKNMAAAISAWKAISEIWLSDTPSIDDAKRKELIDKCRAVKTLNGTFNGLRVVWREITVNSFDNLRNEIQEVSAKDSGDILQFLQDRLGDKNFYGNNDQWTLIEEMFRKLREKSGIRQPPPVP